MADDDIRTGVSDEEDDGAGAAAEQLTERNSELLDQHNVVDNCLELYKDIEAGFSDQWERANAQMDFWDIYYCKLGPKQFYSGNSKIFLPLAHDAVNARKTRFVNQIFPVSGKHVEVTGSEDKPMGLLSLLEFYIRKTKLRTRVMPALVRNGDIEGQYNLYVSWIKNERHVAMRVKRKPKVDDIELEGDEEYDDIEEEKITHQYPGVEVLPDTDVLVLPHTADGVEHAIDIGGSATVIRRWSKSKIRQMIRDKEIAKEEGTALLKNLAAQMKNRVPDKKKNMVDAAGIQGQGPKSIALVYETWTKLKIDGERRICRIYFGGEDQVLGVKRNPYWCDKIPLLSAPVEKIEGSLKGKSKVEFIETLQYAANDAVNEGMDSAAYALLPIIMTDPAKNPRVGSMVLSVAAIWETDPKSTQFAQFPQLWKEAFQIVSSCKEQIFQTLGVNPAMMPQQVTAPGKRPNQAQIANEQQVDILTTADAVTSLEGEILTPLLQWFIALDHQYRDTELTVRAFGKLGIDIEMETIEPIQMDRRFEFRWFGVEAARNAQQLQMQMAGMNMIKGIPPQLYPGYELNLAPAIAQFIENTFGPRLGGQIFVDIRKKMTLAPEFENQLLTAGMPLPVQPMDDDPEHMQAHMKAYQEDGDYHGTLREHMMLHKIQMQKKQQAMMQQQQGMLQQAQQSQQQGGGPRQGSRSTGPRPNGQQPPGAIPRDQLALSAPRARGA